MNQKDPAIKEFRIIEEIDGFRIQKKTIEINYTFFGLIKRKKTSWIYVKTKLDTDMFVWKTKAYVTLEGVKKELERIECLPKYY